MADKLIQINDGTNNLYPKMYKETLTGTIGTSLYQGYYYVDLTLTKGTRNNVVSILIYNVANNRPAFAQCLTSNTIRVLCTTASAAVEVSVWYG